MIRFLFLDSTPLGLLFQRSGYPRADECRRWLAAHLTAGVRVLVPEIIDYELRRELLRLGKLASIAELDAFNTADPDRFLPLHSADLRLAAQLWADLRRQGLPTADPHALDVDVILAAQVLNSGLPLADLLVATSNVAHLSRFIPAEQWQRI